MVFKFLTSEFTTCKGLLLGNFTGEETNYFIIVLIVIKRGVLFRGKHVSMVTGKTRREIMELWVLTVYTWILFYVTAQFSLPTGRFA